MIGATELEQHSAGGARPVYFRVPALVTVPDRGADLKIAAIAVIDRLIVALHRGGAGPLYIAGRVPPGSLCRSAALGIHVAEAPAALPSPVLLAQGNLLVTAADVRACLQNAARLGDRCGSDLPIGLATSFGTDIQAALQHAPRIAACGPALVVTDRASAQAADAALWSSIASASDGMVDRWFNRPLGRQLLSRPLVHTSVTPNAISILSVLIGLAAAWLFARGERSAVLLAAVLFQISAIVDCVDGDIARIMFRESSLGKWIDLIGDQVVHLAAFAGIAIGAFRVQAGPEMLWLGLSSVLGAALSFAVVLRGMFGLAKNNGPLQHLVDAATNRDFSVLVLFLAAIGKIHWFLWLAAIGSHAFWIAALALQLRPALSREAAP